MRKAYPKLFEDNDKTLKHSSLFFLIDVVEIKENTISDINIELKENEGVKFLIYKDGKWIKDSIVFDDIDDDFKTKYENVYIYKYEKFNYKRAGLDAGRDYASAINNINKFESGYNNNLLSGGSNLILGSFNRVKTSSITLKNSEANLRNIISLKGKCYLDNITGKTICPTLTLIADKDNTITLNAQDAEKPSASIVCNKNNYIFSDIHYGEPIIYDKNNIVVNPDYNFYDDVYLMPQFPFLAPQTIIVSNGKEGDDFVEVKDTSRILLGSKALFSSNESGFVIRHVVGVDENKVYLDRPFNKKELPIENGMFFIELPRENDRVEFKVLRPIKKFSRIVYVDGKDLGFSLLGKEIVFYKNGQEVHRNIVNLYSDVADLIILKDPVDEVIDADKAVIEPYKFVGPFTFKVTDKIPNLYIGQEVKVDDKKYKVTGFSKKDNIIKLDGISINDLKDKTISTDRIPDEYYKKETIPFKKLNVVYGKRYLDYIIVEDTEGLKEGAIIKYKDEYAVIEQIEETNVGIKIKLQNSFIPFIMRDKLVYGDYVTDIVYNIDIENLFNELKKIKEENEN